MVASCDARLYYHRGEMPPVVFGPGSYPLSAPRKAVFRDVDPGMAFVLVQHLAPDHKSILTELMVLFVLLFGDATKLGIFRKKDDDG